MIVSDSEERMERHWKNISEHKIEKREYIKSKIGEPRDSEYQIHLKSIPNDLLRQGIRVQQVCRMPCSRRVLRSRKIQIFGIMENPLPKKDFVKKFINDLDYERIEQISQEKLEIINGADLDEKIKNETIQLLKRIKKIINFEDSNRVSLS